MKFPLTCWLNHVKSSCSYCLQFWLGSHRFHLLKPFKVAGAPLPGTRQVKPSTIPTAAAACGWWDAWRFCWRRCEAWEIGWRGWDQPSTLEAWRADVNLGEKVTKAGFGERSFNRARLGFHKAKLPNWTDQNCESTFLNWDFKPLKIGFYQSTLGC